MGKNREKKGEGDKNDGVVTTKEYSPFVRMLK